MLSRQLVVVILVAVAGMSGYALQGPSSAPGATSLVFDTFDPPPCSPIGKPTGGCAPGQRHPVRVVPIAQGLVRPWHISFLPNDGGILVSEPPGRVRIIRNGVLAPQPIPGWPAPGLEAQDLNSVLVHPQFAQTRFIYLQYVKRRDDGMTTMALARGRFDGAQLTDVQDLFVADAWLQGGPVNGHAEFGPDGMIYMSVGDHDRLLNSDDRSVRINAQNLGNHIGKILRLRDDGTAPADNPFVGRADAKPEIYTYGHRTVTGFAWDRANGNLWSVEIGPLGGDELNLLLPGRNYGWPLVSFGKTYFTGAAVSEQPYSRPGMEDPRMFWVPSISPSGVIVYSGDRFPWWRGHILLGALNGQQLQRVAFEQPPPQSQIRESMLTGLERRIRYVAQGPDGYIYIATEQSGPPGGRRGGGPPADPNGVVFRLEPADGEAR